MSQARSRSSYLRMLSLETSNEREESGDRVVLTTRHGAKGLEFPICMRYALPWSAARNSRPQTTPLP